MIIQMYRALLAVSLLATMTAVYARDLLGDVYIGPSASYYHFDTDLDYKDNALYTMDLGYRFNRTFSSQYSFGWLKTNDESATENDVITKTHRLDLLISGNPYGDWRPSLIASVERVRFAIENAPDPLRTYVGAGIGLQRFITDNFALGADARYYRSTKDGLGDASAGLNLHYYFGSSGDRKPVTVAAMPEQSTPAVASPCLDIDADKVCDNTDACKNTGADAEVDSNGCPIVPKQTKAFTLKVLFDFDRDFVKDEYRGQVQEAANYLKAHPESKITVEGYTDSTGSEAYNQKLSERRAAAVAEMLITEYGVAGSRVSSIGYGESHPIAENDTEEGRTSNRRAVGDLGNGK